MASRSLLLGLALLCGTTMALTSTVVAGESQSLQAVWQEGENFIEAPGNGVKCVGQKAPASGGQALWGLALGKKGRAVRYELTLPQGVPDACLIFRYARQFWKESITAAVVPVELTGGGKTRQREVTFGDTKGRGNNSTEWGLATVKVGDLAAGKWSIKLTSMIDDGDVCLDGFLVAPPELHRADFFVNHFILHVSLLHKVNRLSW